jgi:hypothetical protein
VQADAEPLAPPAPRGDSDASARVRPENVGIPKSRMCGPQVRFCERGPSRKRGPLLGEASPSQRRRREKGGWRQPFV